MEQIINDFQRVANAIEKWNVVLKITDINQLDGFSDAIKGSLQIEFASEHYEDNAKTSSCSLYVRQYKLRQICIFVS